MLLFIRSLLAAGRASGADNPDALADIRMYHYQKAASMRKADGHEPFVAWRRMQRVGNGH